MSTRLLNAKKILEELKEAKERYKGVAGYIELSIITQKSKYDDEEVKYYLTCPLTNFAKLQVSRYVEYYNLNCNSMEHGGEMYLRINLLDKDENFITSIY